MNFDTLGGGAITVKRTTSGRFVITLNVTGASIIANEKESHHFGRVVAVLSQDKINNLSKKLNRAAEDFAAAVLGNTNYFIKRMYFNSQPEEIAGWYTPAT